jgi:hypothetical protein
VTRRFCDGCGIELQWNVNWRNTFRSDSGLECVGNAVEITILPRMADERLRSETSPVELCRECVAKVIAGAMLPLTNLEIA